MASFDENGKYIKTNWKAGDKITATKLNKIEESIEAVNDNDISRHVEADARLDALEAKEVAHDKELTNVKNTIADNKAAAELGDYEINSRMQFLEDELNEGIEEVHNVASTVDGKITQGKADMEAMVAEVEADLAGLHAKDEELNAQLAQIKNDITYINIKQFGAKGDGETNDTEALISALNYAMTNDIGTVLIPSGTYLLNNTNTFTGLTNLTIEFLNEVVFSPHTDDYVRTPFIELIECENLVLKGTLRVKLKQFGIGEHRHCLRIDLCKNLWIDNLYGHDASGDCLSLADSVNVNIKSIKGYDCARSAFVLISSEDVYVDNIEHHLSYQSHLSYQTGMHVEPYSTFTTLKNINVKNLTIKGNCRDNSLRGRTGLYINLSYLTYGDLYCAINIGTLNVDGCPYVLRVMHFNEDTACDLSGFVNIENIESSYCEQVSIMNWFEGRSPQLTIKKSHFINNNSRDYTYGDQGLFYITSHRQGKIGNMNLGDISFSGGNVYKGINFEPYYQSGIGREEVSSKIQYNLIFNEKMKEMDDPIFSGYPVTLGNCVADYTKLNNCPVSIRESSVGNEIDANRPLGSEYNNEGLGKEGTIWLSYTKIGSKMKYVVRENNYLNIRVGGTLRLEPDGYNSSKWLRSNTIGSYLVTQKITDDLYYIVEKVGIWEDVQ